MGVNLTIQNPNAIVSTSGVATEINLTGPFNFAWSTFADGDATPDISGGMAFKTANTAPLNITDFLGNTDCLICVKGGDVNTTIIHDATKIFLRGGLPITLAVGTFMWFAEDDGVWYELPNTS